MFSHARRSVKHTAANAFCLKVLVAALGLLFVGVSVARAEEGETERDRSSKKADSISSDLLPTSFERSGQPVSHMVKRLRRNKEIHSSSPLFLRPNALMESNEETAKELGVDYKGDDVKDISIRGLAYEAMPNPPTQDAEIEAKKIIGEFLKNPAYDQAAIMDRQGFFAEVEKNPELVDRFYTIYKHAAEFKWVTRYKGSFPAIEKLNALHKATALSGFTESVRSLGENAKSAPMMRLKEFANSIAGTDRFQRFLRFQSEVSSVYDLNDAIYLVALRLSSNDALKELKDVSNRHHFNRALSQILEAADVLKRVDALQGTTPREDQEVGKIAMVNQLKDVLEDFRKNGLTEMSQKSSNEFYDHMQRNREKWLAPVEYFLETLHEFRGAHVPKEVDLKELPEEISYIAASTRIQQFWKDRGANLVPPTLTKEPKTNIKDAYNFSELHKKHASNLAANDVISNSKENVLLLTGPNSGGKTTYLRMVGQMSWLAQLGWLVPVQGNERAEIQMHDKILTALEVSDAPEKDESRLVAELERAKNLAYSETLRVTPRSLVLFDEFANGTNAKESLDFNKELLRYLSEMNCTSYFSTHKHELATDNQNPSKRILGAHAIGIEIKDVDGEQKVTYKVLRNTVSPSLGRKVADSKGLTVEGYKSQVKHGAIQGAYDLSETRHAQYRELRGKQPSSKSSKTKSKAQGKKRK